MADPLVGVSFYKIFILDLANLLARVVSDFRFPVDRLLKSKQRRNASIGRKVFLSILNAAFLPSPLRNGTIIRMLEEAKRTFRTSAPSLLHPVRICPPPADRLLCHPNRCEVSAASAKTNEPLWVRDYTDCKKRVCEISRIQGGVVVSLFLVSL